MPRLKHGAWLPLPDSAMVTRSAARQNSDDSVIIIEDSSSENSSTIEPNGLAQIPTSHTLATTISVSSSVSGSFFDTSSNGFSFDYQLGRPFDTTSSTVANVTSRHSSILSFLSNPDADELSNDPTSSTSKNSCDHPCPICLNTVIGRKPHCIPCGHVYCCDCIRKSVIRNIHECAICKKNFNCTEIREIFL